MKCDGMKIWYMVYEIPSWGFYDTEKYCKFFFKMKSNAMRDYQCSVVKIQDYIRL